MNRWSPRRHAWRAPAGSARPRCSSPPEGTVGARAISEEGATRRVDRLGGDLPEHRGVSRRGRCGGRPRPFAGTQLESEATDAKVRPAMMAMRAISGQGARIRLAALWAGGRLGEPMAMRQT